MPRPVSRGTPVAPRSQGPFPFALALALALPLLGAGCTDTGGDPPGEVGGDDDATGDPVAAFWAAPWQAQVGQSVSFRADDSADGGGVQAIYSDCDIRAFRWEFGDGASTSTDVYFIEHPYSAPGLYPVTLTVEDGAGRTATTTSNVEVVWPPPVVDRLDVSVDSVAVIGEKVRVLGEGFRADDPPQVAFGGVPATSVTFVNEGEYTAKVAPSTPSGPVQASVTFPDGTGEAVFDVWVKRYALVADAFHDRVHVLSFGGDLVPAIESQAIDMPSATVVQISGDGAIAVIGDGRYELNATPTLTLVDLTADFQPVVTRTTSEWGLGPLFDVALARDVPRGLVADLTGITVIDFSDPYAPTSLGRTPYETSGLAATDVELTPDGSMALVLGTFDDRVRFYQVDASGAAELPFAVDAGEHVQDLRLSPDGGRAYVLAGGGEGAIPPDLGFDNTTLTVIDLTVSPPVNALGSGVRVPLEAHAPVPFDLDVGASGRIWVSSFDQNFGVLADAFTDLFGSLESFFDVGSWEALVDAFSGIGFGGVTGFDGVDGGSAVALTPIFAPYGFQTGIDVRYDERLYVASAVFIDFRSDTSDLLDIEAELNMSFGVVVGDLQTGHGVAYPLAHDALLSYADLALEYDLSPLLDLVTPPFSYGDVALQP
ncbi:PKD domain-containing protein [Myxococcota bacterium]|nr:PKD domain-containing protein [Myxococcota bacterium]